MLMSFSTGRIRTGPRPLDSQRRIAQCKSVIRFETFDVVRGRFKFGVLHCGGAGMHIAQRSIILTIFGVLWAFDVQNTVDPKTGDDGLPQTLYRGYRLRECHKGSDGVGALG